MRWLAAAAGLALSGLAAPAHAQINLIDVFNNASYEQTSGSGSPSLNGYFFDVGANYSGDYAMGTATVPTMPASTYALSVGGGTAGYGSPLLPLAAIQALFPTGMYSVMLSGGTSSPSSATMNYTGDVFASAVPMLTAASFNALQGYMTGNSLSVMFNPFTQATGANYAATFFTIFNAGTGQVAFTDGFLSSNTTSVVIPAGTLAANTQYDFELDFSDRIIGAGDGYDTLIGSDVRTDGAFTTAGSIPEPGSVGFLGAAFAGLLMSRRRSRADRAAGR